MLESDKKSSKKPASTRKKAARSGKAPASDRKSASGTGARKSTRRKVSAKKKATSRATSTAGKSPGRKRTAANKATEAPRCISVEERHRLIAERAYLMAEARGFRGGDPREDWLAAEAEIDARLLSEGVRIE